MSKIAIVLSAIFLLATSVSALDSLNITFDIQQDKRVRQEMVYEFNTPFDAKQAEYIIYARAYGILVTDDTKELSYELEEKNDSTTLKILLEKPTKKLSISFLVNDAMFTSENINHFFTELSFDKPLQKVNARVLIPENYAIYQDSYMPGGGTLDTDGKRIMIAWNNLNTTEPIFFSVKMVKQNQDAIWVYLSTGILAFLLAFVVFLTFYYKGRTEKAMLKGFREDEQKAIGYIQQHTKVLQKDLQKEFMFSRAKSTRIVKKLHEKGMIKKEEFGRTNRIEWVK